MRTSEQERGRKSDEDTSTADVVSPHVTDNNEPESVEKKEGTGETGAKEDKAVETGEAGAESVEALRRERDEYHDRLLRTAAEFDNYRKRVERERQDMTRMAAAGVLLDVLRIVDDLERALEAPAPPEAEQYRRGVELIHRQMLALLERHGVTAIDAVGTEFDPNIHEAVFAERSPDHPEGHVLAELQRGYRIGDRLLRPSRVKVAKA